MTETHTTFCRICEALCGLNVTVEGGRVVRVEPDPQHVATEGFACTKGLHQHQLYDSPDRLARPLERAPDGSYREASWQRANADIGARVRRLREEHGADSIAMYVGTAAGFSVLHPVFAQGFMTGLGSKSMYSSATQDCSNKFAVARLLYGFPFTQPFPDVEHTQCLIVVGANPVVSKWSFLQVPNPMQKLRAIEQRGGKLFFVDPRRTESAKIAGTHVFIRPGTDVYFYLAFMHEVIARDGVDRSRVTQHMRGFDALEQLARAWTPERAAEVTRMPAEQLRELVGAYLSAGGAALYCSTGVNMGGHGALSFWLQEAINAVTGNLDRRGGSLVGEGIIDFAKFGVRTGTLMRDDRSRIGGFGSVNDGFPGGLLADEILTPGKGRVRALFVTGGNPLLTMPNSARLREAFEQLDLLVCLDIVQGETASVADWVLPCTSPLERPDLPFIFPLMLGLQLRPYLQATRAVVPPHADARDEATIYTELARASGAPLFGSRIVQLLLDGLIALRGKLEPDAPRGLPQEGILSFLLRICGQRSFADLLTHPHGWLRPPHRPGSFLGKRVYTEHGLVELAPESLLERARRLDEDFAEERRGMRRLKLITKRAVTSHNSWTHNLERFVSPTRGSNYLYMHPNDAERAGLSDGALADVQSSTASVRVPVRILGDLMEGTVALPHGWGHQHAKGTRVAGSTTGVNANLLAADGPRQLDRLSGMAHLTGIPVDVRPAAGPRAEDDWSGMPG